MNVSTARACLLSQVSQPCNMVASTERAPRLAVSSGASIDIPYLRESFWNMRDKKLKLPSPPRPGPCCKIVRRSVSRGDHCLLSPNHFNLFTNRFAMHTEPGSQFRSTTMHENMSFDEHHSLSADYCLNAIITQIRCTPMHGRPVSCPSSSH